MPRPTTAPIALIAVLLPSLGLAESLPPSLSTTAGHAAAAASERSADATVDSPSRPKREKVARRPVLVESTQTPFERAFIVDPRVQAEAGDEDLLRVQIHGQYALRFGNAPGVRLSTYDFENYSSKLGQTHRLEHQLRLTPRVSYRRLFSIVAQADVPQGMLAGETTDHVDCDPLPLNERQPMRVVPRWLYLDINLESGHLLVGQQPATWGLGLVDNSGDDRQFLGTPKLGTIVDRIAYRGRPLGQRHPWELLVATDWVFSDGRVEARDGDRAMRVVLTNSLVVGQDHRVGLLVAAGRIRPAFDDAALKRTGPHETRLTFDLSGHTESPVAGINARVFASAEAAWVTGKTDLAAEVLRPTQATIQRVGAIARVGLMQSTGPNKTAVGPFGIALEWGYASGDADPGDGTDHRFTMSPSRRTGLLLFDEALRWKTARSAVALEDPRVGLRATTTSWGVASGGGVTGATYLMPELLYRPLPQLDIRTSAMIAQSTADVVDPLWVQKKGRYFNYDGGDVTHRDWGLELDAAVEYRHRLDHNLTTTIGVEAAALFPGQAFADANGRGLGRQALLRGRFGFYF